jgi:hypothetical protein
MHLRQLMRFALPLIVVVTFFGTILHSTDVQAYSADVSGAQAYANDFCPDVTYPEDKIADVMWISAPGGGNSVDVVDGGVQDVPVTINFYATFCANWPQGYNNGATDMEAWNGGVNRLSSHPAAIGYGPKTAGFGTRSGWGVGQYSGTLNVAGLGTGDHQFCTYFRTTTDRPGTTFIVSPNLCFFIHVNRIIPWTTSGESKVGVDFTPPNVSSWTASPNQMLYWRHTISSATGTTPALSFAVDKTGFFGANVWGDGSAANHNKPTGSTSPVVPGSPYNIGWGANRPEYSTYRVVASDGGRTLCQHVSWSPSAWNNGGWSGSAPACVTVPFDYNLVPSVTGPSGVGTVGGPIPTVTPRVNNQLVGNAAGTTDSPNVQWELRRIEVAPGGSIPMTQQENGSTPCIHYGNNCGAGPKASGTRTFPAGSVSLAALTGETIAGNTPVGTRICYTLSVRPYSQTSGNWRHSAPVCIKVSKQPKIQVWGHDARTRGGIETGTTIVNSGGTDKLFGSWVEYGGFSVGANDGFASGAGLNTGNTNTSTEAAWHRLTFANLDNSGSSGFGMFTLPANLPTITDQFISAPSSGSFGGGSLTGLTSGKYEAGAGTTVIDASTIGQVNGIGKSIIIVSTGTVTINGNITYEGNGSSEVFTDTKAIPQVVIIARNINITNAVSRIDSWLLTTSAAGMINTCSDVALNARLNSNVCNNVLTVNGPVATQHLHLRRTGGSNTVATAGDPAEIFNLRPDAYIWAYGRSSQSGKAQTVYSVELPPRF